MPVQSLNDVRSFLTHVRQKLVMRVEELTPEAMCWRPAPEKWTPLEHLEHVALVERQMLARLEALLAQPGIEELRATPETPRNVDAEPVLRAAGAIGTPKKAGPDFSPSGRSLDEVKAMLTESRTRLMAAAAVLDELDTDRMLITVPMLNATFNAAQFLHFIASHEWLHDQHIKAVLKARHESRN